MNCLNCEASLQGAFCHRCGQRARPPLRPMGAWLGEWLRELFDLDGRVARSVRALLTRPGFLTQEYVAGRRRHWTPPLRLYLGAALALFAVASASGTQVLLFITRTGGAEWIVDWLPRVLVAVVPAFATFHYVLFRRSRSLWVESLVFSLHLHAGWFLLASVPAALRPLLPEPGQAWTLWQMGLGVPVVAAQAGIWIYLWLALRSVHGRSAWATAWRVVILVTLHALVTALGLLAISTYLD